MENRRRSMMSGELPSDGRGFIGGYEYVDLGLPSGKKWATCNIGATSETGLGDAYTFGGLLPLSSSYDTYVNNTNITGNSSYDVVMATYGNNWYMPTRADWQELKDNTTITYHSNNGNPYHKITKTVGGVERYLILPLTNGYLYKQYGTLIYVCSQDGESWYRASDRNVSSGTNKGPYVCCINNNEITLPKFSSGGGNFYQHGLYVKGIHN